MNITFYRLTCLTNLHMGSGDVNYDVIDLEVERDPVTGEPTMNSSGVKGALRDKCEELKGCAADPDKDADIVKIFGTKKSGTNQGSYAFFAGDLLARPVRMTGADDSYVLATTPELLNQVIRKLKAFGLTQFEEVSLPANADPNKVYSTVALHEGNIEGYQVEKQKTDDTIKELLGTENYVLMTASQLKGISLPVQAHNVLENGTSKNLWYEEYVPHASLFGLLIGSTDNCAALKGILRNPAVVQFGAEATTGCGYMKMEEMTFNG